MGGHPFGIAHIASVRTYVRERTDKARRTVQDAVMSLPSRIAAHAFPHAPPYPTYDSPVRWTSLHSYIPLAEPSLRSGSSPVAAISGTQARVLIADEEGSAGSLVHLLHGLGYWRTETASSGANALELAREFRPSIVLIALDLPDMSAQYIARCLRGRIGAAQLRLIALADDHSLASRDRVHESGFLRYLTKPFDVAALQHALRIKLS